LGQGRVSLRGRKFNTEFPGFYKFISLTKIEPVSRVDVDSLSGVLYRFGDDGVFQAYEYEQHEQVDIAEKFLEELSLVIHKFKLENVLALDVRGGTSPSIIRFEYDYGRMATVAVELNRKPLEPEDRLTGMAFSLEDSELRAGEGDVYARNIRGTHTVFYNHKSSAAVVDEDNFEIDVSAIRGVLISNQVLAY